MNTDERRWDRPAQKTGKNRTLALRFASIALATAVSLLCIDSASAGIFGRNRPDPQAFPTNPLLEETKIDPLLPGEDRPLSPEEQQALAIALDGLHAQATAQLNAGDPEAAFTTWFRELWLRRKLGILDEIAALDRVGRIAWKEERTTEIRWIGERLQIIQTQVETPPEGVAMPPLMSTLPLLAQAYQGIGAADNALNIYDQILAQVRAAGDQEQEINTLYAIAQLHSSRFNYGPAAATYQELLELARFRGDQQAQEDLLVQLAYIYQQDKKPNEGLAVRLQLLQRYEQTQNVAAIPELKIAIAADYLALDEQRQAAQSYIEAYTLARAIAQYQVANTALQRLGDLYLANNLFEPALEVYLVMVDVSIQGYNYYDMMYAYDRIGQIYLIRQQNRQALEAFQRGLELARRLNYREDYFNQQIANLVQPRSQ